MNFEEITGLTSVEGNLLVEISTDSSLKIKFNENTISNFWFSLRRDHFDLSKLALQVLIPFTTTYLCEKGFSAPVYIKNKYRNRLKNVECKLRNLLLNILPDINILIAEMLNHPSH